MNSPLYLFYHFYADGNWKLPVIDQFYALWSSNLLTNLNGIYIGFVGKPHNIQHAKSFLDSKKIPYQSICETEDGWEQETLDKLLEFSQTNDGYVLYSHTKGAGYPKNLSKPWRRSMIWHTVMQWEECVKKLDEGYTTVGGHWIAKGGPEHGDWPFWAGNMWWAKLQDIRHLPPATRNARFDAEHWIGELTRHMNINQYDLNPYFPEPPHLTDNWESNWKEITII